MTTSPPPPGFETSRPATSDDLKSLPSIGQQAVQALEQCIKSHHVAETAAAPGLNPNFGREPGI